MTKRLINLNAESYEHSLDKAALAAMKAIPMFTSIVNFTLNWTSVKWRVVQLCGSNFHVTEKTCPELYNLVHEITKTLDVDRMPKIYTEWKYGINAYTTGFKDNTILNINSGTVDLLNDKELTWLIGHEIGHIKSGHVLYHVMAQTISVILMEMGIIGNVAKPIEMAILYWNRMSEFTADRAGLLACQDLDVALSTTMKMAGIPIKYFNITNPSLFAEQAHEFLTEYGDTANKIIRNVSILDRTHPWTVLRAAELVKWVESGGYQAILDEYSGKICPICDTEIEVRATKCPVCGNTEF